MTTRHPTHIVFMYLWLSQKVHSFPWAQQKGQFHVKTYEWAVIVVTTGVRGTLAVSLVVSGEPQSGLTPGSGRFSVTAFLRQKPSPGLCPAHHREMTPAVPKQDLKQSLISAVLKEIVCRS